MKLALVAVIAACGGAQAPRQEPTGERSAVVVPAPAQPQPLPVEHAPATAPTIQAPHGGSITTLAVTADGGAVVSADELGDVRLWPVLDGTREPRVVQLAGARSLAITRAASGFHIAMVDNVGGLTALHVDNNGATVGRWVHPAEPAFVGIEAVPSGFIGWRADQTVMRISADGAVSAPLATPPGEQLVSIAIRNERAFAVVRDARTKLRVRKLVIAPTLAWGDKLSSQLEVGPVIAVSPNGAMVASIVPGPNGGVPDDRRGIAHRLHVYKISGEEVMSRALAGAGAFAFITDDKIAAAVPGRAWWFTLERSDRVSLDSASGIEAIDAGILAVGAGRAIIAAGNELMFSYPNAPAQYLGYDLETPGVMTFGPEGNLLVGAGSRFLVLDDALRTLATPSLGVTNGSAAAFVRWLGGDDWLLEHMNASDGTAEVRIVRPRSQPASAFKLAMTQLLHYEPSTQLATLSHGPATGVYRVDRAKRTFTQVGTVPKGMSPGNTRLVPLTPSLASGMQVAMISTERLTSIRWLKEPSDLTRGVELIVDGSITAVSRAGHVFVWESHAGLELVVYRNAKRLGVVPTVGAGVITPDPSGTAIALILPHSVSVVGIDGTPRWSLAVQNVLEVVWGPGGELAIMTVNGVARVDSATGVPRAARCGWGFGIASKPHPASVRVESMCTQLAR
ncbi:MAG: hypothetical protein SFX73_24015 [Kofleriaceae bacterium]|nr:hypothetical protein [Kofleriaceae bacterium]